MDLFSNVLGGFLAAVAFAAAGAAWHHARRPYFIPFQRENWSEETKTLLARAGVDARAENVLWVINYDTYDHLARGSRIVRVRSRCFSREVRAARKDGYAVLMTRPSR